MTIAAKPRAAMIAALMLLAVAVTATVAGCGRAQPERSTPVSTSPATTTITPPATATTDPTGLSSDPLDWPTPTVTGTGPVDHPTDDVVPTATWDDVSRQSLISAAGHALAVYGQPGLDFQSWFTQVAPLMTADASNNYRMVDPSNIPFDQVDTASCQITNDMSALVATVTCGTNAGPWEVIEARTGQTQPWLAVSFLPQDNG